MIWQLMKLDVSWRYVTRTTILFTVLAVAWHFTDIGAYVRERTLFLLCFVPLFSIGITPLVQPGDIRFQTGLPVTVRQVFAARMLSTLSLQWLPVAAIALILIVLGGGGLSVMPLAGWSVITCIVLAGQCAGIRGLTLHEGLPLVALPASLFLLNMILVADWHLPLRNYPELNFAIVCCWMVTGGLVARTWQTIPKAFELARGEAPIDDTAPVPADRTIERRASWKPVLRTLFPLWGVEYPVIFLTMCGLHSPIMVLVVSGQGWTSMRTAVRWMQPLPVRRRVLLAAIVLPGILSLSCGYLAGINLRLIPGLQADTGLRSQMLSVVFVAGWSMVANLFALAGDWYAVRRVLPPRNDYGPGVSPVHVRGIACSRSRAVAFGGSSCESSGSPGCVGFIACGAVVGTRRDVPAN